MQVKICKRKEINFSLLVLNFIIFLIIFYQIFVPCSLIKLYDRLEIILTLLHRWRMRYSTYITVK